MSEAEAESTPSRTPTTRTTSSRNVFEHHIAFPRKTPDYFPPKATEKRKCEIVNIVDSTHVMILLLEPPGTTETDSATATTDPTGGTDASAAATATAATSCTDLKVTALPPWESPALTLLVPVCHLLENDGSSLIKTMPGYGGTPAVWQGLKATNLLAWKLEFDRQQAAEALRALGSVPSALRALQADRGALGSCCVDVVLQVGIDDDDTELLPAHRVILQMFSKPLAYIVSPTSPFADHQGFVLRVQDDKEDFAALLDMMYRGPEVLKADPLALFGVLDLAFKYLVPDVEAMCSGALDRLLTPHNVGAMAAAARALEPENRGPGSLWHRCIQWAASVAAEVFRPAPDRKGYDLSETWELDDLVAVFETEDAAASERDFLQVALKWRTTTDASQGCVSPNSSPGRHQSTTCEFPGGGSPEVSPAAVSWNRGAGAAAAGAGGGGAAAGEGATPEATQAPNKMAWCSNPARGAPASAAHPCTTAVGSSPGSTRSGSPSSSAEIPTGFMSGPGLDFPEVGAAGCGCASAIAERVMLVERVDLVQFTDAELEAIFIDEGSPGHNLVPRARIIRCIMQHEKDKMSWSSKHSTSKPTTGGSSQADLLRCLRWRRRR